MPWSGAWPDPLEQLTLAELRSARARERREHPPDVLPLWVAEMDVPLAEPVQRVLHDAVARDDTGYPRAGCWRGTCPRSAGRGRGPPAWPGSTSSAGPAEVSLREARVALSAGPAFGTGGAGHVRLDDATSAAVLEAAVTRMGRVASGA